MEKLVLWIWIFSLLSSPSTISCSLEPTFFESAFDLPLFSHRLCPRFSEGMFPQQPFPSVENTVCPDPSTNNLWAPALRKAPLPTNTFWQNFVLRNGSVSEYLHPYSVQSKDGMLSVCYPTKTAQEAFILQVFVTDLSIGIVGNPVGCHHMVSYYDDLSVTLDFPGEMTVPLVRGCPYITCIFGDWATPKLTTIHAVLQVLPNGDCTKHRITMNNGQTWLVYSSSPFPLSQDLSFSGKFKGVIRLAVLPKGCDSNVGNVEEILDRFSSVYPIGGHADFTKPFELRYEWKTRGSPERGGELLMLSLPLHREIIAWPSSSDCFLSTLAYDGIDGRLEGIVGNSWVLKERSLSIGWYSSSTAISNNPQAVQEIAEALRQDVSSLQKITNNSTYYYGKAIARAARLALIAEEIGLYEVIAPVRDFLKDSITPWMDGSFSGNAFLFDDKWGGLISRNGAIDSGADFGLALYNDHHYHFGYFCYAGAVLAKLDPSWGKTYKSHLYTIMGDYMTHERRHISHKLDHNQGQNIGSCHSVALFPRFRNFDFWVLHSWAGGLTEFWDGRNQESTSEAVNAYYAASLLGLAFGDASLVTTGLTLAALESRSAQALWHVSSSNTLYEAPFVSTNRVVGIVWANKRDSGLWFAPPDWKDCRLGIQFLPILPISRILFPDPAFAHELFQWVWPCLSREGTTDCWKGFAYALQALYDPQTALENTRALSQHDDGNSLSNMLWWIYSVFEDGNSGGICS